MSGLWYAIGHSPSAAEITSLGPRYSVVVLNAWDVDKMHLLKTVNPSATVLVYKDLASTRSYPGAVDNSQDARSVPTGVGYIEAQAHPEWFARDAQGDRIEWKFAYPEHWQMATWSASYQHAWVENVTNEVLEEGWDGVLADNDIAHLGFYTDELIAGTTDSEQTDQLLRDGLDSLINAAGWRLNKFGKLLIPNISEARLFPGRWSAHSRFGGGMEEYFPIFAKSGVILTVESTQWDEMLDESRGGSGWLLLMTHGTSDDELRTGFALAALLGGDKTSWMPASTGHYEVPAHSPWQDFPLGSPEGGAVRDSNGAWHRQFTGGWVVVNPTDSPLHVASPRGTETMNHKPAGELDVAPGQSVVLINAAPA